MVVKFHPMGSNLDQTSPEKKHFCFFYLEDHSNY